MQTVDLKKLSEMAVPERAFLTVYLSGPDSVAELDKKFNDIRRVLLSGDAEKNEREYFEENIGAVGEYLKHTPPKGSLGIFACRAIDFFQTAELPEPVKDIVRVDSSPYIRPLAELQDDYETVAVVVADGQAARIFLVASSVTGSEEVIRGNIKNHVKVGGWSQQRYERRRDKQLQHYAREIAGSLVRLEGEEKFRHILLVGSKEILREVHENIPKDFQDRLIEKNLDLSRGDDHVNRDIMALLAEEEHHSQEDCWEKIRTEYLRGGLAVVGLDSVLWAAGEGRVEKMIVNRGFHPAGRRCRNCHTLQAGSVETCRVCGSSSLFIVSMINELLEMLLQTGAESRFTEDISSLAEAGEIAALLRY